VKNHAPEALITFRVLVLSQLLSRLVDASVTQQLALSSRQWRVLVMLNRLGPSTSGDLARMAHLDHSQVSRVSFELADLGLVAQDNDASDRRKQVLSITREGLDKLKEGLGGSLSRESRLRGQLSDAEYDTFCRVLQTLTVEAQQMLLEARPPAARPRRGQARD
jgi:DNA-binding MarR family transcriptional regulator